MGPRGSGGCIVTRRSKRPGLSRAWSRTSARLVAARTITPLPGSKPSISVRIWLSVCSCSSLPPIRRPALRLRPMASSSSMKMIAGADWRAFIKRSRTREAPTPTIASTNSEADQQCRPEAEQKGFPEWRWRVLGLGVDGHAVLLEQRFQAVIGERRPLGGEVSGADAGAGLFHGSLGHARYGIASSGHAGHI